MSANRHGLLLVAAVTACIAACSEPPVHATSDGTATETSLGGNDIAGPSQSDVAGSPDQSSTDSLGADVLAKDASASDTAVVTQCGSGDQGKPCDDGRACTGDDYCAADGSCSGKVNCSTKVCNQAACTPEGACEWKPILVAQKQVCNDGNACTLSDVCVFGTCSGVGMDIEVACSDNNDCTTDECAAKTGCVHAAKPVGTACTDGNPCTFDDKCNAGASCISGSVVVCNSGDPCQSGSCDTAKGCIFGPMPNGTPCPNGGLCVTNAKCTDGSCKGTLIPGARSPSPCLLVYCDPATGAITSTSAPNGTPCNDGNPNTKNDVCSNGVCVGTP